jgi:ABC-type phosphate transport system permease subunit
MTTRTDRPSSRTLVFIVAAMAFGGFVTGAVLVTGLVAGERTLGIVFLVGAVLTCYTTWRLARSKRW